MCKQRTFKKTNVFKPFSFSLDFFSLERFRLCLYFKQLLFRFRLPLFFAHHISRIIHTHTNASSFFWSRSVVVLISLSVSSERSSISLLRRRRSRSKKKEARLFHSLRRRAFPTLGEKSRNRPFFLSRFLSTRRLSFTNTRRAVEHQRSSLTRKRSLSSFRAVKAFFFISRSRRKNVSLFVILSFQL